MAIQNKNNNAMTTTRYNRHQIQKSSNNFFLTLWVSFWNFLQTRRRSIDSQRTFWSESVGWRLFNKKQQATQFISNSIYRPVWIMRVLIPFYFLLLKVSIPYNRQTMPSEAIFVNWEPYIYIWGNTMSSLTATPASDKEDLSNTSLTLVAQCTSTWRQNKTMSIQAELFSLYKSSFTSFAKVNFSSCEWNGAETNTEVSSGDSWKMVTVSSSS